MNADTWTRLQAFRHALELTSCEASLTAGYDHLKDFPAGCSELASQTLTDYLTEDGSNLYSCIVGMQWDDATALWFASSRISAPTQAQLTGCNVCTSLDLKRQLSGF
ncbi:hypothetical protein MLK24_23120 [Escherichia coli]|nr:hypothetical protein [Escherichia coli]